MTQQIRVGIVEGDADILFGRRAVLEAQADIKIVLEEDNANRALERIPEALVDVLLIDQRLQGNEGVWLVTELGKHYLGQDQPAPVMIMTAPYFDNQLLVAAIRAGATDLITQDAGSQQLVEAVFNAANKDPNYSPEHLLRLFTEIALEAQDSMLFLLKLGDLSERERDVLRMLLHGRSEFDIAERIDAPKYRVRKILDDIQGRCGLVTRNQLLLALVEAEGRIAL